jgi:hypothetical protein
MLHRVPPAALNGVQLARLSVDLLVVLSAALVLARWRARRR